MNALIIALAFAADVSISTGMPLDEPKVCISTKLDTVDSISLDPKGCCPAQTFTAVETGPIQMIEAKIMGWCKVKLVVTKGEWGDDVVGTSEVRESHKDMTPFLFEKPLEVTKGKIYTMTPVVASGSCSWGVLRATPQSPDDYPFGMQGGLCPKGGCAKWATDFIFRVWCSPVPQPPVCEPVVSKSMGAPLPVFKVNGPVLAENPLFKLLDIPEPLQHAHAFLPKQMPVKDGEEIKLSCCGKKDCVFFVSLYKCPACGRKDGGLLSTLPGAGWSGNACAPVFGDDRNPMVTYSKVVKAGKTEKLPMTMGKAFLAIFMLDDAKYLPHPWCPKSNGPHFSSTGPSTPPACAAKCPKY